MRHAAGPGLLSDPSPLRPDMTVLSDLSANIFAGLLLILVVLLQVRALAEDKAARRPSAEIDAARDLGAVPHRALSASALMALLAARNPGTRGLDIDLTESAVTIVHSGEETTLPESRAEEALASMLGSLPPGEAVRLYVFSAGPYRGIVDRLRDAGMVWDEVSVPRALRGTSPRDGWSPDFLALAAGSTSAAAFRDGLARLLVASSDRLVKDGHVAGRPGSGAASAAGPPASASSVVARLLHALGLVLGLMALAGGIGVVGATEWLVPHTKLH